MRILLLVVVAALVVPVLSAAAPKPPPAKVEVHQECDAKTSIVVKLRYQNGEREEYRSELDTMDIVFDDSGHPTLIHLVLFTGPEKDTHKWIPFSGLSSFAYRFCNVSGKGKVRLSVFQPFFREGTAPKGEQGRPEMPAVTPKDYR
ncbi:MAG: hypothetical protein WCK73_05925 [Deltaproteobacteria bacterium]